MARRRLKKNYFAIFGFFYLHFAEGFSLPRVFFGPRQRLCRVPDKGPSVKTSSPTQNFPRAALGKAFAKRFWAFGPRQRTRVQ
jgi:hypothetical protein